MAGAVHLPAEEVAAQQERQQGAEVAVSVLGGDIVPGPGGVCQLVGGFGGLLGGELYRRRQWGGQQGRQGRLGQEELGDRCHGAEGKGDVDEAEVVAAVKVVTMNVGRTDEHQVPGLQGLHRLVYQVQGLAVGDQEDLEKVVGVQGRGLADAVLLQEPHLGLGGPNSFRRNG